jgi:hypothetical protein
LTLNSATDPLTCWELDFKNNTIIRISGEDTSTAEVLSAVAGKEVE